MRRDGDALGHIVEPARVAERNACTADVVERAGTEVVEPKLVGELECLEPELDCAAVVVSQHLIARELSQDGSLGP